MDNLAIESNKGSNVEMSEQTPTDVVSDGSLFYSDTETKQTSSDNVTAESNDVSEGSKVVSDSKVSSTSKQEPTLYTVKHNGMEKEVTLEEMRSGYMMETDYRFKTSELAEDKRKFESTSKEKIEALDSTIQKLEAFLKEPVEIDLDELRDIDPSEYLRVKETREAAQKALTEETTKRNNELAEQRQSHANAEFDKLDAIMADRWNKGTAEENKAAINKDIGAAKALFAEFGVSEQEAKNVIDHRIWNMLIDLADTKAQLKTFQDKKERVTSQVEKAPTTVKTGGKTQQTQSDADLFYG